MTYTDIIVGRISNLRQAVQQFFEGNEFQVEWIDQYSGIAKKGSKRLYYTFGALAEYYEFSFQISILEDQTAIIRLSKKSSGAWGGLQGVYMTRRLYKKIVEKMQSYFYAMTNYKSSGDAAKKNNATKRSTGVIVGGIIALIGAVLGLFGWYVLTGMANAYIMSPLYFLISPTAGLVAWFTTPSVYAFLPLLVLSGSILAIVFSVVLISGRFMRVAAGLIIFAGILSIQPILYGIWLWAIPGVLEVVGVALVTGAW